MTVICRLLMGGRRFRPSATFVGGVGGRRGLRAKCSARAALSRYIQRIVVHGASYTIYRAIDDRPARLRLSTKSDVRARSPGSAPGGRLLAATPPQSRVTVRSPAPVRTTHARFVHPHTRAHTHTHTHTRGREDLIYHNIVRTYIHTSPLTPVARNHILRLFFFFHEGIIHPCVAAAVYAHCTPPGDSVRDARRRRCRRNRHPHLPSLFKQ